MVTGAAVGASVAGAAVAGAAVAGATVAGAIVALGAQAENAKAAMIARLSRVKIFRDISFSFCISLNQN